MPRLTWPGAALVTWLLGMQFPRTAITTSSTSPDRSRWVIGRIQAKRQPQGFGVVDIIPAGYTGNTGDVFNLLDWSGALNGSFGTGANFSSGGSFGDLDLPTLASGLSFYTSAFTTYGIVVVVPEPGRMMLLLLGLVSLCLRRRRKQVA